jgi:DNA invertase Pin-like site-specific DNA recombinase
MRVALYLRVSKGDGSQTTENQWLQLRKFVEEQHWAIFKEYQDHESAGPLTDGKSDDRSQFKQMMADAQRRKFDVLVFWALDRFTRDGAFVTLTYLNQLSSWGVAYRSYQEQYLDTVGIFKEAVIAILAVIAQQERLRIRERVKAGVERARANGVRVGVRTNVNRPPGMKNGYAALDLRVDMEHFRKAVDVYSIAELSKVFRIGRSSVYTLRAQVMAERKEATTT